MTQKIERRRIYQSSKTSYALTLPPTWIRLIGLRSGERVEVELICNDVLIIRPVRKRGETVEDIINKGLRGDKRQG